MIERRSEWRAVLAITMVFSLSSPAVAQGPVPVNRALATREDLRGALAAAGKAGSPKLSARDRETIERRLQEGDFQPGDRLVLSVLEEKALSDTFTVRADQILVLPDMEPLSLRGVLRSELQDKLLAHISQYIRNPNVTAEALLRIGILGSVLRPGYYNLRADIPLGDVPSVAGGFAPDADLGKARILRDGKEYWPRDDVRRAMASGRSLDVMGLKGGDEFQVGRHGAGFGATLAIVTGVATLATTILLLAR
jgi:protein involved in polysaccharide export with SLBB domain